METEKPKWNAKDVAPMPTKGLDEEEFQKEPTILRKRRFPWITILAVAVVLAIIFFFLFSVEI